MPSSPKVCSQLFTHRATAVVKYSANSVPEASGASSCCEAIDESLDVSKVTKVSGRSVSSTTMRAASTSIPKLKSDTA